MFQRCIPYVLFYLIVAVVFPPPSFAQSRWPDASTAPPDVFGRRPHDRFGVVPFGRGCSSVPSQAQAVIVAELERQCRQINFENAGTTAGAVSFWSVPSSPDVPVVTCERHEHGFAYQVSVLCQNLVDVDGDGDGFPAGDDCNDTDPAIHPGAPEVCNEVDDNCNGQVDEGVQSIFYRDADDDRFGAVGSSTQACTAPSGYISDNTDCNDGNAAIYPGAPELCNQIDDNCNGTIDEGVCEPVLQSLTPPLGGIVSPEQAEGMVTLTRPALSGGAKVMLSADTVWPSISVPKPNVISVQNSVIISQGVTSATFSIVTNTVLFPHLVRIKASFDGVTKTAELTVLPPAIPSSGPEADARVQAIIDYFREHATGSTPLELYSDASVSSGGIRTYTLYDGSPKTGQDIHLAAADHYLFWLAAVLEADLLDIPIIAGIVSIYDLAKWVVEIRGSEAPTSPSTLLSTQWGWRGVIDGLRIRYGAQSVSQLENIDVTIQSPVDILVSDSAGHKIGFDPSTRNIVNDFGPLAFYTGPGTEPQTIFIGLALPGPYTVTGIGTGSGPYTLTVTRRRADGSILETQTATGVASLGTAITPLTTVIPAVDACIPTTILDNFKRADGNVGNNWRGATSTTFYRLAGNRLDVQAGGPLYWNPTAFGTNQAAFVTLSTVAPNSPSQGVLLKVQSGTVPNTGAIAVVYDAAVKAVRVSTFRLGTLSWTPYGNTPLLFTNGDKLGACAKANGEVRVYKNDALVKTVTLNTADQRFFNAKGGKVGVWSLLAPRAFLDNFGGATIAP